MMLSGAGTDQLASSTNDASYLHAEQNEHKEGEIERRGEEGEKRSGPNDD